MSRLAGKVAVVTGSGRGIGRAIATRYAREGAKVVVTDILGDNAEAVAAQISDDGGEAIAVTTDVSQPDQVDALVATCVERFGGLDVMLCNAGKVRDAVKHVLEADIGFFDGVIAANLRGHYLCSVAAAHHMARHGGGVGSARERDPAAVLRDVVDGYVSIEAARRLYGVRIRQNRQGRVLLPEDFDIQENA